MGSLAADAVVERAAELLVDRTGKTWPQKELLRWLNDAQLAVLQFRPDAYTATRVVQLAEGTRQALPDTDLMLLDIPRNMGEDGETPGLACRFIDRKQLDLEDPAWHNRPASATVRHWMYDRTVPKVFFVYPRQPATGRGYVELEDSTTPPPLTINGLQGATSTSVLGLDDIYLNPLLMFTLYRAHMKDSEYTRDGKGALAYREFLETIGAKTTTDQQFSPKRNKQPRHDEPRPSSTQGAF